MKKFALAAVLAAAAIGAHAQNVSVYGIVDAAIARDSGESQVRSGGLKTNRLGFRGTEDLGNGLSAKFQLEQGFDIDTGTSRTPQFGRQAWVGLSSKEYGEVRLGRTWTSLDDLASDFNNTGDMNIGSGRTGDSYIDSLSNQVKYISPSIAGFQGSVGYAPSETVDKVKTVAVTSAQVTWTTGHTSVGYGYQNERPATSGSITHHLLGAKTHAGPVYLTGSVGATLRPTSRDNEVQAGVSYPMGKFTAYAGAAQSKTTTAGLTSKEVQSYNVLGTYDLSKRTALYAGYRMTTTTVAGVDADAKRTVIGVRHSF